tara:strand:+ start:38108 stop:38977 length:870 start_codon:yes stop_codon:yes gene_type:complete
MIPHSFDYMRPQTLSDALQKIEHLTPQTEVAILAGGQSLLSALKQRRTKPNLIVDLGSISDLSATREVPDGLEVGAMVRQVDFAGHHFVHAHAPIFQDVAAAAGDPMIRRNGTLVGAFCEVDPRGDWVAAGLVQDAILEISSLSGTRREPLESFAGKPRESRLKRGELVTKCILNAAPANSISAYRKCKHNAVGWSIAGVAVVLELDNERKCRAIKLAAAGATTFPQRLRALELELQGVDLSDEDNLDRLIRPHLTALEFFGDSYASAGYREKRLAIQIRRTLAELTKS